MSPELSLQLQKEGATARAAGKTMIDNPFLRTDRLPASTGETVEKWQTKHDAWHLGWTIENMMYPG